MKTKFYTFNQNNSGGSFVYDEKRGISEWVIIEAKSSTEANDIAKDIGIYFDGISEGKDCPCCGDRWHPASEDDGKESPMCYGTKAENYKTWFRNKVLPVAIHYLDGTIKFVGK